ncbi:MAG: hypothetical protein H7144_04610 [Burkholderiales bacterium]|nr:hypothetical protein [Phycisphaerae bacterium]
MPSPSPAPVPSPAPSPSPAPAPTPKPDLRLPQARAAVAEAEKRLAAAKQRLEAVLRLMRGATTERQLITRQLAEANDLHGDLQRQIAGRERQAKDAKAAAEQAHQLQTATSKVVGESKKSFAGAQRSLKDATAALEKQYLKLPETIARQAAIDAAESALRLEHDRVVKGLAGDEEYQKLQSDADARETALKHLRDDPQIDSVTLTDASQKWIDAKSRVDAAERAACANDPKYVAASEAHAAARKAQQDAIATYKAGIPTHPDIVEHTKAIDQASNDLSSAENRHKQAERESRAVDDRARTAIVQYNDVADRLHHARLERDQLADAVRIADQQARQFQQQVTAANTELAAATRALAEAKRALAELEQVRR